ncbi:hypothetical protein [Pseudobacteroides cellulosolvens]|uniref:Uncharacterized protein n=2 Tax=Pseudobacteroides cellulosolvens TaxID=35825 RepID=A0A0L6JY67_9FIRM|nr:hypothetical protein [Pseudobacteroides cellulosolvens]KNY30490.1 hypothetical protein Bccel_5770 [Pseudobacteroides cellulosolvens ATCC 35603 = DSM 2933]
MKDWTKGWTRYTESWTEFTMDEINAMASEVKSLENSSEMKCSSCGKISIRHYYREISTSAGVSWYWCYNCRKCTHFRGAPRSKEYVFNDPISSVPEKGGIKWYEYLNSLWDEGILPQIFKKKGKSK